MGSRKPRRAGDQAALGGERTGTGEKPQGEAPRQADGEGGAEAKGEAREILIELPYRPRKLQQLLHRRMRRFNVIVCHRRFGKSVLGVNHLIRAAVRTTRPRPRFAYLAPYYKQAKSVAWDYLKHFTGNIPGVRQNESELRVDLPNGARLTLLGADNPDALRGIYLDGVVLDEFGQMAPRVFSEIVRPALADREGFAIFIGTPKGRNGFYRLYERARNDRRWFTALYRASETGILSAAELADAREMMSADEYAQEFECSFQAAVAGAYYAALVEQAEAEGRIGNVPYDPRLPVHTAWDLGIDDATAIWFCQQAGPEIRIVDYYESSGVGLDHYARVLQERRYLYGDHMLPQDAQVRELGTGRSRIETLAGLGIAARPGRAFAVEDGINAVRLLLPRCWFDATRCARGLEALRQYRRDFDEKLQSFRARPVHDWASHAADAFRYLAVGLRERSALRFEAPPPITDYDPFAW